MIVIDDTLTCLAHAHPDDPSAPSRFATDEHQDLYDAAFDAWSAAKTHIHEAWMWGADPANLTQPLPKVMRDAADLVRVAGMYLGDRQDDLVGRLQAPYSPRIQRAVRDVLANASLPEREKVDRLLSVADQLGLVTQPGPKPLPAINPDDVHLVCWTAIVPNSDEQS